MAETYAADISVYQGDVNYPLLVSMTQGVICRASIGVQEDLLFDEHWSGLLAQNHNIGSYHFLIPDINGVYQADAMLEVLGTRIPKIWKPLTQEWVPGVYLDCEYNTGLSKSALAARIKAFVLHIKAERSGWEVGIYTRGYWWNDNIGLSELAFFSALPLWIARYTTLSAPWGNVGDSSALRPVPWNSWTVWQFSADGNDQGDEYGVESDDIDLDRLSNAPVVPPPPPPVPPPGEIIPLKEIIVTSEGLNVRSLPNASSKDIGTLIKNSQVPVVGTSGDWYRLDGWINKNYTKDA